MKLIKDKLFVLAALSLMIVSTAMPLFAGSSASALSGSQFKAGRIIDDSVFYDYRSMTPTQIQAFLNSKVTTCTSGHTCLKSYKQNTPNVTAESGICNNITGYSGRSAANIIYDVTRACGVSPKVMLVLLQKEQGLVESTAPSSYMYKFATGFCVYDTTPPPACSGTSGFFNQVYYAARQFKKYRANPTNFNFVAGQTNFIPYNPSSSCGGSNVYIENQATAGLYNYTPYQPNKATLSVGLGVSAPCGAYGNKNFWWYFNVWFGTTYGTPFFQIKGSDPIYIVGANNTYYRAGSNGVLKAYGYGTKAAYINAVTSSYVSGMTYKGNVPLVARFDGGSTIYLMNNARAHRFPGPSTYSAYSYVFGDEADLAASDYFYLIGSSAMQTVMKQSDSPEVYYVEAGKKHHITGTAAYTTLGSPVYSTRPSVTLDKYYASRMSTGSPILASGSFVKTSDTNSYGIWDGTGLQAFNRAAAQDLALKPDYAAPSSVISQLPAGGSTLNKLAKDSSNNEFILDKNKKLSVGSDQLSGLGLGSATFVTVSDRFLSRLPTSPMQTLIKVNGGSAVYSIISGELYRIHGSDDFTGLGFSWSNVLGVNPTTKGVFSNNGKALFRQGRLTQVNGAGPIYLVDGSLQKKYIPGPTIFSQYGFKMSSVTSVVSSELSGYATTGNLAQVVKDGSNVFWLVDTAVRHKISATLLGSGYYNIDQPSIKSLSNQNMSRLAVSSDLTNLIKASGNNRVYRVENGHKRWFASRSSFLANGGDWSQIIILSPSYVASIPTGTNIN